MNKVKKLESGKRFTNINTNEKLTFNEAFPKNETPRKQLFEFKAADGSHEYYSFEELNLLTKEKL